MAKAIVRNVSAGWVDGTGFHPIRASADYDPDRAGDSYGARSDNRGTLPRAEYNKLKKAKAKKRTGKKATKKAAKKKTGKRNPVRAAKMPIPKGIPRGKFVLARFNSNGTVSVAVPTGKGRRNPMRTDSTGHSVTWVRKGKVAARSGRYADMYSAWKSAKGKPKTSGGRATAQESFFQGFMN